MVLRLLIASALFGAACQSTPEATPPPRGLMIDGYQADARLDHAASLLCIRETDGVIDGDIRRAAGLSDGQVVGTYRTDADEASLRQTTAALLTELGATHVGTARARTLSGKGCIAAVGARRSLTLHTPLPSMQKAPEAVPLDLTVDAGQQNATLYVARPNGNVTRRVLDVDDAGRVRDIVNIGPEQGRYIIEVLTGDTAVDPEVALYWSFVAGRPAIPPAPEVLFPDAGHNDLALSRRAEALVQRLRNDLEIESLKVKPELIDVAAARASALTQAGALGHRIPFGEGPAESAQRMAPSFHYSVLVEVQAQASTLHEAWRALLLSPAHRYELSRRDISHFGAAVNTGHDAAQQKLLTLVVVLARKITVRPGAEERAGLFGKLNVARHNAGTVPLGDDPALRDAAQALAQAAAGNALAAGDTPDMSTLSERAEAQSGVADLTALLFVVDDPLRIGATGALIGAGSTRAGIGLFPLRDGRRVVVILLAPPGAIAP